MDDHIALCSQLFSAAKYEFKHLEFSIFTTAFTKTCGNIMNAVGMIKHPQKPSSTHLMKITVLFSLETPLCRLMRSFHAWEV